MASDTRHKQEIAAIRFLEDLGYHFDSQAPSHLAAMQKFHERMGRSAPAGKETAPRKIDGKFSTDGIRIFNTVSGEEIPDDEPLVLFRARDHNALAAINAYEVECREECNDLHMKGIAQVATAFSMFRVAHPERMKQPGITRHLKLEAASPVSAAPTATPCDHLCVTSDEHVICICVKCGVSWNNSGV